MLYVKDFRDRVVLKRDVEDFNHVVLIHADEDFDFLDVAWVC